MSGKHSKPNAWDTIKAEVQSVPALVWLPVIMIGTYCIFFLVLVFTGNVTVAK